MADISRITLPSGTTYEIKDAVARKQIGNTIIIRGTTTTPLTDEATTNPIIINDEEFTVHANDADFYLKAEYVFDGTKWHEFGDMSGLGALSRKDSASANYTPTGSVTKPSFTGTKTEIQVKGEPTGTVSQPAFTGVRAEFNVTGTPTGSVTQPTFTGDSLTASGNYTPKGSVVVSDDINGNYQPAGNITTPQISLKTAGTTTTVNSITDVGTLPQLITTVENENLTISFNRGDLPTKSENIEVKTGDAEYKASEPVFTGNKVQFGFSGQQESVSVSGTPSGTISQPTFIGEELISTGEYTPQGTISQPVFSGDEFVSTGEYTPEGTVSTPEFTGNTTTITVS